jgi:hypothetical protein
MASGGKKKTTMAKLDRERRMRERRMDKAARKDARKLAAEQPADAQFEAPRGDVADESDRAHTREPALHAGAGAPSND